MWQCFGTPVYYCTRHRGTVNLTPSTLNKCQQTAPRSRTFQGTAHLLRTLKTLLPRHHYYFPWAGISINRVIVSNTWLLPTIKAFISATDQWSNPKTTHSQTKSVSKYIWPLLFIPLHLSADLPFIHEFRIATSTFEVRSGMYTLWPWRARTHTRPEPV